MLPDTHHPPDYSSLSTPLPLRRPLASCLGIACPCGFACGAAWWPGWWPPAAIGAWGPVHAAASAAGGPPSPLGRASGPWIRPKAAQFARARGQAARWALNDADWPGWRPPVVIRVPGARAGGPLVRPKAKQFARARGRAARWALRDADQPGWRPPAANGAHVGCSCVWRRPRAGGPPSPLDHAGGTRQLLCVGSVSFTPWVRPKAA